MLIVRIQLLRDDGTLVLSLDGNALGRLFWEAPPGAELYVAPGLPTLAAFSYESGHGPPVPVAPAQPPHLDVDGRGGVRSTALRLVLRDPEPESDR